MRATLGAPTTGRDGCFLPNRPVTLASVTVMATVRSPRQALLTDLGRGLGSPADPAAVTAQLVTGPAGMGKTHLLRTLAERVGARGGRAYVVSGETTTAAVPLGAFLGLLAAADLPADPVALVQHLTRLRGRVGLCVDNVDRLDPASQAVVSHLVRDARFPAVLSARDLSGLPPLLAELYDAGAVEVRALPPLTRAECASLAAAWVGGPVTPELAARLTEVSEGRPLFVREVVRGSLAAGALVETVHGWDLRDDLRGTERLAALVGAPLRDLSPEADEVACQIALAGVLPRAALAPAVTEELLRQGVIDLEGDLVVLDHPLYAEIVLDGRPEAYVRELRSRTLDLVSVPVTDGRVRRARVTLALATGAPLDRETALSDGRDALAAWDLRRAGTLADSVLASDPTDAEALLLRGEVASLSGDAGADELLARARRAAADPSTAARVVRAGARHLAVRRHDAAAAVETLTVAMAEEWMADLSVREAEGLGVDLLRWQVVAGLSALMPPPLRPEDTDRHGWAVTLLVALITGPLDLAREAARILAETPAAPGSATGGPGDEAGSDDGPDELADLAGPAIEELARLMLHSYAGDVVAAREVGRRAIAARATEPALAGSWEYTLGILELLSGDAREARRLANRAVDHLAWRDPLGLRPASVVLAAAARLSQGDELGAEDLLRDLDPAFDLDPKVAMMRAWVAAWRERSAGRRARAAELLVEGALALRDQAHVFLAAMLAHTAVLTGEEHRAPELLAQLAPAGGVVEIFAEHARAVRARDVGRLAAMVDELEALGLVTSAVEVAHGLARAARERGEPMTARRWDVRAAELVAASPPMARWTTDGEPERLSRRELEIVGLVVDRLTSREISARLGITVKTVDNHLGAIYRKLGVSGRVELRRVWAEQSPETTLPAPRALHEAGEGAGEPV